MTFAPDEKPEPLTIDIVSDAVCPWCYIGKRNLEAALAELPRTDIEIVGVPISSIRLPREDRAPRLSRTEVRRACR